MTFLPPSALYAMATRYDIYIAPCGMVFSIIVVALYCRIVVLFMMISQSACKKKILDIKT